MTKIYTELLINFSNWLSTLGYSESIVYHTPKQLQEFLEWLESKDIISTKDIEQNHGKEFIEHFTNRPNKRRAGGLGAAHINKQIDTLEKLAKYLKLTENQTINFKLQRLKTTTKKHEILTTEEVKELYQATYTVDNYLLGIRDRAMLGVYYGCGLRKKEGLQLEVSDIDINRKLINVRHPKNKHERVVSKSGKVVEDLEHYIYQIRPLLLEEIEPTDKLFLTEKGVPIQGQSVANRLKYLVNKSGLRDKKVGLHLLRHSIATHLLQAGMTLENIAIFLGHKSLDSTQLYTHLANE